MLVSLRLLTDYVIQFIRSRQTDEHLISLNILAIFLFQALFFSVFVFENSAFSTSSSASHLLQLSILTNTRAYNFLEQQTKSILLFLPF